MLEFTDISVTFDDNAVLCDASHRVPTGEIHALTGASGVGKTTLLRAIAGLIPRMSGTVRVDGKDVTSLPTHRRGIGLAFQEPYLFESMSVGENIGYGLAMRRMSRSERAHIIDDMLRLIDLPGHGDRNVSTLSGGQQRRVALARHLAPRPRVLLLDEPFTALDTATQSMIVERVHAFVKTHSITVLASTHLQFDASKFADQFVDLADRQRQR